MNVYGYTSIEDETVNTDFLIASHAYLLNKTPLIPHGRQGSHGPAVAITTLAYICGRGTIDEELRVFKDLLDSVHQQIHPAMRYKELTDSNPLNTLGKHLIIPLLQPIQVIPRVGLQINLEIKMRIRVLLIHPLTLDRNAQHSAPAFPARLFVRLVDILALDEARGWGLGQGIWILGKDGEDFSGRLGVELVPESSDGFLGV